MAIRLSRIERELGELLSIAEDARRRRAPSATRAESTPASAGVGTRHERAAGARHLAQDGAGRAARAARVHRAARRVEFARRATATAEVREAVVISTCNRTEVYLVVGDPVRAESDVLGLLADRARHPPDRARRGDLLAAQLRRRAPALPRHRGPRVDDRRRGRDPGPGQARPRGRDAGRLHRAAVQPPVRRRADDRQARALGDRRSARAA